MDIFNNREIAIGIWLIFILFFLLKRRSKGVSFESVCKAFFHKKILRLLGLLIIYIIAITVLLSSLNLWNLSQLKNTIIWTASVGVVSMFRVAKVNDDDHYFRNTIADNFRFIVILEFVVAFYALPLMLELFIVPVIIILAVIQGASISGEKYRTLNILSTNIVAFIGLCLSGYAIYMLIAEFNNFFQVGTLNDFVLPIILTLCFLPFLFLFWVYIKYEVAFIRINFLYNSRPDPARKLAKLFMIFAVGLNASRINQWLLYVHKYRPESSNEFLQSVRTIRLQIKNTRSPPSVPFSQGWSPYSAFNFIGGLAINPNSYHEALTESGRWVGTSSHLDVGNKMMPNYFLYTVSGNELAAKSLKLVAYVNQIEDEVKTIEKFVEMASELVSNALDRPLSSNLVEYLYNKTPCSKVVSDKIIEFGRNELSNDQSYQLEFIVHTKVSETDCDSADKNEP